LNAELNAGDPSASAPEPEAGTSYSDERRQGFPDLITLSEFIPPFIESSLWRALMRAMREALAPPAGTSPIHGVILAEDPLLGLAAAALYGQPEIHIPVIGARLERMERLSDAVSMHYQVRSFVRSCRSMPQRATPSLMLAWNTPDIFAARDAVFQEIQDIAALRGGLLCLCDRRKNAPPNFSSTATVIDVCDIALPVLAAAMLHLELPGLNLVSISKAEALLVKLNGAGITFEKVIAALNTPAHGDFLRYAQRVQAQEWPDVNALFERYVMCPEENRPREAASLFLVSHFSRLSPRQLIELGDALILQTPMPRPARDAQAPPAALTDKVLADCNIGFIGTSQGDAFANLMPDGEARHDEKEGGGPGRAEHLRWLFENEAPLLRERYLQYLGDSLVLGHTSKLIAHEYIRHEAQALRAAAAHEEPYTLAERLRRAVYGNAATLHTHGAEETSAQAVARRIDTFLRALDRVPALLEEFVGPSPNDRLLQAVRTLCSADPSRSGFVTEEVSRVGGAYLFWSLYAQYLGRLKLRDYLSLFRRTPGDRLWRIECLRALHEICDARDTNAGAATSQERFELPDLLVFLIGDILQEGDKIVEDAQETSRGGLLAEAWMQYLRKNLHGMAWHNAPAWEPLWRPLDETAIASGGRPCDLALAQLLLANRRPPVADWIRRSGFRIRTAGDGTDEKSTQLYENGRSLFLMVHLVLDAVVGCAAFEDFETFALDVWLLRAMSLDDSDWNRVNFGDARFWASYCGEDTSLDPGWSAKFRTAIDSVFDMFPVIALMAATHAPRDAASQSPTYVFSAALREWLEEIPRHLNASPARLLLERVERCFAFQDRWREAHDSLQLRGVDWDAVNDSMADRCAALRAFATALHPIARSSRPSALRSKVQPAAAAASQN
jgi:hypothetical protein